MSLNPYCIGSSNHAIIAICVLALALVLILIVLDHLIMLDACDHVTKPSEIVLILIVLDHLIMLFLVLEL